MEKIKLPEGWHVQKTGGRPKKDAKFIGVVLARTWRTGHLGEKKCIADKWILEKWSRHGITDEAHIRTIVRRMTSELVSPLRRVAIVPDLIDGYVIAIPSNGKKGWLWSESMTEAIELRSNVYANFDPATPVKFNLEIQLQEVDKTQTE